MSLSENSFSSTKGLRRAFIVSSVSIYSIYFTGLISGKTGLRVERYVKVLVVSVRIRVLESALSCRRVSLERRTSAV